MNDKAASVETLWCSRCELNAITYSLNGVTHCDKCNHPIEPVSSNEQGRELLAHELKVKTVVLLAKEGRPMVTMWVVQVSEHFAMFYGGMIRTTMLLKRNPDGTLEDDSTARIKVYEYLGEI